MESQIIAAIELPIGIDNLTAETQRLRTEHGEGLVMRQVGSRLLIATPGEGDPLGCWCWTCDNERRKHLSWVESLMRGMILCPDCGNKRCPKANHHDHACTGSNEPGQPGSAYPGPVA